MAVKSREMPFEKALERLETIVDRLETGSVPLEEAIKLFEEGVSLRKRCLALREGRGRSRPILMRHAPSQDGIPLCPTVRASYCARWPQRAGFPGAAAVGPAGQRG